MNQVRRNKVNVIISTDLLCRGIDIQEIDLVINYDMPSEIATYFHRIGRTGRFGRNGVSLLISTERDEEFLQKNARLFSNIQEIPSDFSEINQKL